MSGIYIIKHYVMTWSFANCEQGLSTGFFNYSHCTTMNLGKEKQLPKKWHHSSVRSDNGQFEDWFDQYALEGYNKKRH